ncbi:glyoxylase-like metal-dependent hydrolase (beta-lactamase superfamily II) [Rubricella aquisinus]|uniref:Glyoxylase-like metal-dependent hydrolase (Beta-lactamase superfamily II) n=1 Tax=Rubricella aquisinus TaxID=2028108 RepID=A0A840WHS4_9RHOB|nr:MBL fold metallo-hydrolase [Rubricella aquisinus]MBB5514669.1 glyoxylase-like metal-dependent hydrolase (beta-lactamase superfamily II) [Rubricella aquisinus]
MSQPESRLVTLAPGLRRLRADNPSPMTFTGTNTYLLGTKRLAVIDPGPADPAHIDAILRALEPGQEIAHIFVTHAHVDHSPGARLLQEQCGAPIYAYGSAYSGLSRVMTRRRAQGLDLGMDGGVDRMFYPDHPLKTGDVIEEEDWSLEAHHTPGHLPNHMCFLWREPMALFTGDHIMGWATSMIAPPEGDWKPYQVALKRIAKRTDLTCGYAGHGEPIEDVSARAQTLHVHRRMRARQVDIALCDGPVTPMAFARATYNDTPEVLIPAAACNVLAYLLWLEEEKLIVAQGPLGLETVFERLVPPEHWLRDDLVKRLERLQAQL